jgi:hypothetical protein
MKNIHDTINMEKRLRIVIFFLILFYLIVLGTAFYYQIIGDQDISKYVYQKNPFEWKLVDMIKEDLKKIYEVAFIASLVFFLLIIGKAILITRRNIISHFFAKCLVKFKKSRPY